MERETQAHAEGMDRRRIQRACPGLGLSASADGVGALVERQTNLLDNEGGPRHRAENGVKLSELIALVAENKADLEWDIDLADPNYAGVGTKLDRYDFTFLQGRRQILIRIPFVDEVD